MAKEGEGMSLFPEIFTSTRKLSDAQFGALIRAGRRYQTEQKAYEGDDVAVDIAFQFLANQIDRRSEASAKKTEAAKKRWGKADECSKLQSDAPIHSIPIQSIPIHSGIENQADEPPAPTRQTKKSFGEFGWVKLTDDEYSRLFNDLGEAEAKRCIAYVDESAQSTGNKNKWRDWNLVVRKCHKQGWGLNQGSQYRRPQPQNGPRGLDEEEIKAIAQMMAEQDGPEAPNPRMARKEEMPDGLPERK